jgi:site-specific recombinase XerC
LIPSEKKVACRPTPAERCAQAFGRYLLEERALAHATIINYVPFIRSFLKDRFGAGRVVLSRLCAGDVVRFVQRQAPRLRMKRAKLMTTALRSFLNYGRYLGEVSLDLAAAVPTVANWSMTSIPRAISAEHARQLLASIDQRTPVGRGDYAILLLLARLGLRLGEVAFLELDNIDWNAGQVSVRGKGGRQRAGIHATTKGAHQFRHGLATEMPRQGASLGEIGELLGHRHPQTTKIYTKVDIKALRALALPWPGGVQ